MLQLHYRRRSDGQHDMRRAWWGVCGRQGDGQMRVRARLPPVSARLSPTTPPPPHLCGGDSLGPVIAGTRTDGRTGDPVSSGAR